MPNPPSPPDLRCTDVLADALIGHEGALAARLDYRRAVLELVYDPRRLDHDQAARWAQEAGQRVWEQVQQCPLAGTGFCHHCVTKMREELTTFFGHPPRVALEGEVLSVRLPRRADAPAQVVAKIAAAPALADPRRPARASRKAALAAGALFLFLLLTIFALLWLAAPHGLA